MVIVEQQLLRQRIEQRFRFQQLLVRLMRGPNPDHICGLCDEFDVDQAAPQCAAEGKGRCLMRTPESMLHPHVPWDGWPCVSFRLDWPNLRRKRQFVTVQRRAVQPVDGDIATKKMET